MKAKDMPKNIEALADGLTLKSVMLTQKMNVFGIHSDQISTTMGTIKLEWRNGEVYVTSESNPGKVEIIHAPGIAKTVWEKAQ